MQSPLGALLLAATEKGLCGIYFDGKRPKAKKSEVWVESEQALRPCRLELEAYFRGELKEFKCSLDLRGTDFQKRCWEALRKIPFGEICSYGDIAREIGSPKGFRAVGQANHNNPVPIIVPCHRVIGANGSLTGFSYADFLLGLPYESQRLNPIVGRTQTYSELGMFAQDAFKVSSRLTLDLGLRWDRFGPAGFKDGLIYNWDPKTGNVIVPQSAVKSITPLYPTNLITVVPGQAQESPSLRNFVPRIGVAYRPFGDKFVVRGGYGIFNESFCYFTLALAGTSAIALSTTRRPSAWIMLTPWRACSTERSSDDSPAHCGWDWQ